MDEDGEERHSLLQPAYGCRDKVSLSKSMITGEDNDRVVQQWPNLLKELSKVIVDQLEVIQYVMRDLDVGCEQEVRMLMIPEDKLVNLLQEDGQLGAVVMEAKVTDVRRVKGKHISWVHLRPEGVRIEVGWWVDESRFSVVKHSHAWQVFQETGHVLKSLKVIPKIPELIIKMIFLCLLFHALVQLPSCQEGHGIGKGIIA